MLTKFKSQKPDARTYFEDLYVDEVATLKAILKIG
jgi:hypothetical protein